MSVLSMNINKDAKGRFKPLAGKEIRFDLGLNFLVGENGIGKSTIVNALWKTQRDQPFVLETDGHTKTFFFDTEKMNPRVKARADHMFDVHSHFLSHGECLFMVLKAAEKELANGERHLFLVDEPESGISPWNQKKLREMYVRLSAKHQLIIATHSLVLTRAKVGQVIKLTKRTIQYFSPASSFNWGVR